MLTFARGAFLAAATTVVLAAAPARADSTPEAKAPEAKVAEMKRGRFSGGRFVVEIIVGGAAGSLAAYATFRGICGDEPCLGGALTGWLADFAVTPAAVWGIGNAMGGQGRLAHAYYGAIPALAPFSATDAPIGLQFGLSAFFLPITSAVMYELSSHLISDQWTREHEPRLVVRPSGATVSLRF